MSFDLTNEKIAKTYQHLLQQRGDDDRLYDLQGNEIGDLRISGSLTAQTYVVSSSKVDMQIATNSGSTAFGDSNDDTHIFTGSLLITGSQTIENTVVFGGGDIETFKIRTNHLVVDSEAYPPNTDISFKHVNGFGRLGMNVDSPDHMVHISGSAGSQDAVISLEGANPGFWLIGREQRTLKFQQSGDKFQIYDSTNSKYNFSINPSGYIGIGGMDGGTQPLQAWLHVSGSGDTTAFFVEGNISGSATSTGSFGTLRLDYDAMPTSDPSVKGAVWRDGTDLKISAG
tara:strand:+ start:1144 stop:1998 length:855 start_codon:yes stop_codon:yes gene_type:complete